MLNDLSYGIKIWTELSSFWHNSPFWQTDRRTGSIFLVASPLRHSMQRGKTDFMWDGEWVAMNWHREVLDSIPGRSTFTQWLRASCSHTYMPRVTKQYKKLIRRWDSKRELSLRRLSLRRHRARTTKYNILVHKFRHRSTRLCVGTHVYQIQWNNAI